MVIEQSEIAGLADIWQEVLTGLGLQSESSETTQVHFNSLVAAYAEPHRHYHTMTHIAAMLNHWVAIRDHLHNPFEVALAIWFHDAIYKPFSRRNELASAEWASRFLNELGYCADGIARVERLVMVTLHGEPVETVDEQYLVDIDLTILGSPTDVYDQFEKDIRQEYRYVPNVVFRKKRKALLKMFLDQPRLYQTDYFYERYELQARKNLERIMGTL